MFTSEGTNYSNTQLANERTFLAWLRTSLMCVSMGIGLAQINHFVEVGSRVTLSGYSITFPLHNTALLAAPWKPMASVCIVIGIVVLLIGVFRFYYAQRLLSENRFPVSTVSTTLALLMSLVIVALYLVLAVRITY